MARRRRGRSRKGQASGSAGRAQRYKARWQRGTMRILAFQAEDQLDKWRMLRASYRYRVPGPSGFTPVVQVGADPDRMAAALEIKKAFDGTASDEQDPVAAPFELVLEQAAYSLIKEYWTAYKSRIVTPDTVEDALDLDEFLKDAPKLTPEEWKEREAPTDDMHTSPGPADS